MSQTLYYPRYDPSINFPSVPIGTELNWDWFIIMLFLIYVCGGKLVLCVVSEKNWLPNGGTWLLFLRCNEVGLSTFSFSEKVFKKSEPVIVAHWFSEKEVKFVKIEKFKDTNCNNWMVLMLVGMVFVFYTWQLVV